FFFSSRRRHTRSKRDWSSDVCSSDLDVATVIADLGARHILIKPHCPWQNGKVERFNRTLATDWAYRRVYSSNADRAAALAPWLEYYNTRRRHTALGGLPPTSRL